MTRRHQPPFEHQPTQPDRADDLVRLYQQACALSEQAGAQPNPAVRAAVLAAAAQVPPKGKGQGSALQADVVQNKTPAPVAEAAAPDTVHAAMSDVGPVRADAGPDTAPAARADVHAAPTLGHAIKLPAKRRPDAANDARWKIRANHVNYVLGSLAVLGLVGLLASRFLPDTAGYAELAQTLPSASYQQQAATQPSATSAQPQAETAAAAPTDSTAAGASTPSPMSRTEQAAAANAEGAKDATVAAAATEPNNEEADAPLPVARPAAAPAPKAAAKGKPSLKQTQPKAQQQAQQSKSTRQPLAVPSQSSAMQAQQPSTQPHQAEHAEATATLLAVHGAPSRSAANRAVGDSKFDQAANRQASRSAKEQEAASPFPLDDAPVAAKGRLKSAAPHTSAEPAAAAQPRVQGREPWAESVQLAPPAASDLSNERLFARRSLSVPGQAQELTSEIEQGAMPSVAPHIAAPHVSAQSKRGPLASPAAAEKAAPQATALFASASRGDVKGVQRALQAGAAINGRDAAGRTPLMRAAANGHLHVVRVLLRHGADVHATDAVGRNAVDYARLGGHERVAQLLSGKP